MTNEKNIFIYALLTIEIQDVIGRKLDMNSPGQYSTASKVPIVDVLPDEVLRELGWQRTEEAPQIYEEKNDDGLEVRVLGQSEPVVGYVFGGEFFGLEELDSYLRRPHDPVQQKQQRNRMMKDRRMRYLTESFSRLGLDVHEIPDAALTYLLTAPADVNIRSSKRLWDIYAANETYPDPTSRYGLGLPNSGQVIDQAQREVQARKYSAPL